MARKCYKECNFILKGEKLIMRKVIKKIATVVASVSMVAAMSLSAFATTYDTYQFAGNPNLVGEADPGAKTVGWVTVREQQFLEPVDGLDGVYSFTGNYVHAADYDSLDDDTKAGYREFKILGDGDVEGWNHQLCLGTPDAAWADNQTQFRIDDTLEEGEFKVYVDVTKGFVAVIQNHQNVNMLIRFHSRDEDSANFVKTTKAAILADGYEESAVYLDDDAYLEFVNQCLKLEGGEAITALYEGDEAPAAAEDDTTVSDDNANDKADAEKTTAVSDTKTSSSNSSDDKEDDGLSKGAVAGIVVAVVAVIGIIVAVVKKKN